MDENNNDMYNYGAYYDPSTIPTNCEFILSKNGKYLMMYKAFKKEGYFPYSAYYQDENAEPPKKREDMNEVILLVTCRKKRRRTTKSTCLIALKQLSMRLCLSELNPSSSAWKS